MTRAKVTLDPPTRRERFFGVVAYLCWYSPLYCLAPLVLYFWKGKTSRFIGFHAVQSALLTVMCIVIWCVAVVSSAVAWGLSDKMRPDMFLTPAAMLPFVAPLAMALAVFFRRRAVLPVLGRWTDRIITPLEDRAPTDTSPAAVVVPQAPDERIHAGTAYLSNFVPPLWIWYPVALYFWKGRRERFIGFHAVQSLLLVVTLIPVALSSLFFAFLVVMWMQPRFPTMERYTGAVGWGIHQGGFWFCFVMIIGMGIYVMRGGRGVLPILGRLAKLIIGTTRPPNKE